MCRYGQLWKGCNALRSSERPRRDYNSKQTALSRAAWRGWDNITTLLLKRGAEYNLPDQNQNTALRLAANNGHEESATSLLTWKIQEDNMDSNDVSTVEIVLDKIWTDKLREDWIGQIVCWAARRRNVRVIELLRAKGFQINDKLGDMEARTALQVIAGEGDLRAVHYLLEIGADPIAAPNDGLTALQAAAQRGQLEVVNRLLEVGANLNTPAAEDSLTAIQAAAQGGHLEVVNRLLEVGANLNTPAAENSLTAIQAAAQGGHLEVVNRLLEVGANFNDTPAAYGGRTALQAAAQEGHLEVVNRLLEVGANPNDTPAAYGGLTALQAAAEGGHQEVITRLLEAGAKADEKAIEYAEEKGRQYIVSRLREARALAQST
ncbi:ankyrin repeat-containing domain protein [Nemania sp. NC0429]|nr:ankyrin repeat-containing domain protein [Nemania sp. NC0429]